MDYEDVFLHGDEDEYDTSTSILAIKQRTGIYKYTSHRLLQRNEFHQYQVQFVQSCCREIITDESNYLHDAGVELTKSTILDQVFWSDETTCKKDGYMSLHNLHSGKLKIHIQFMKISQSTNLMSTFELEFGMV